MEKPRIAVVTGGKEGLSIIVMAHDLVRVFRDLGYEAEVVDIDDRKLSDKVHHTVVVNVLEYRVADLHALLKFKHPLALFTVFASNPFEFEMPLTAGVLAHFRKGRSGDIPIRLIAHSPVLAGELQRAARDIFAPSLARQITGNTVQINWGVRDEFAPGAQADRNLWVVPYNRFAFWQKDIPLHIEVSAAVQTALAARKHKVEHVFRYLAWQKKELPEGHPYTLVAQDDDRDGYMAFLRRAGLFLCTSRVESFGIYYLELLASGCVGVFLDKEWNRLLLPNYRYRGSSAELPGILAHVHENHAEARAYVISEVIPEIRSRLSLRSFAESVLALTATAAAA